MKRFLALVSFALAAGGSAFAQDDRPVTWIGPEVTLQTTMGDIVVTLDPVGAPKTAGQFLALARAGYFDGAAVYRVEPGFVIQLGDLDAKLQYREPPLPAVPLETAGNKHAYGAVAMAHGDDPNDGRATFYIDMAANAHLNAAEGAAPNTTGYAVFGHVTSGMTVAEAIDGLELAPEGGPFPGRLPKVAVVVNKAVVTREWPTPVE
jgi:cyclophilin family peptidyl-prolyl cis-trans isomerase